MLSAHIHLLKTLHVSGVGVAVRFLVVGPICKEEWPPWGKLRMEQYLISDTGLYSTQKEQILIIFGVWPFWLTPFFFRSITLWWVYG